MLCLEVLVNGERQVLAGVQSAETIETSVAVYPELDESWLKVSGGIVPEAQPSAHAHWLATPLQKGDCVEVRLVESSEPTPPQFGRTDTSVMASDAIPFVCAFCGKSSRDVEGMTAGARALICHGCVRSLNQLISGSKGNTEVTNHAVSKPEADDGRRPRTGVVVSLLDLGDGTSRLIMDDVSSTDARRETSWKFELFYTHKHLNSGAIDAMALPASEYEGVGEALMARLVALNGRAK